MDKLENDSSLPSCTLLYPSQCQTIVCRGCLKRNSYDDHPLLAFPNPTPCRSSIPSPSPVPPSSLLTRILPTSSRAPNLDAIVRFPHCPLTIQAPKKSLVLPPALAPLRTKGRFPTTLASLLKTKSYSQANPMTNAQQPIIHSTLEIALLPPNLRILPFTRPLLLRPLL